MIRSVFCLAVVATLTLSCSGREEGSTPIPTTLPVSTPIQRQNTAIPTSLPLNNQPTPGLQGNSSMTPLLDITYCTVNSVELKMDVYFPDNLNQPAPAVVYVHGGAWSQGDKRAEIGNSGASMLTQAGFVVFALNYRLAPEYRFPAMIEDVKCAIRSIRAHSLEYNIDPNRIAAFGASAGGHLVSLLGTSDANAGFDVGEYPEYSSRVQAVIDMFGPTDLTLQFSADQIQNARNVFTADQLIPASPVTYITPDDPPFLILQGDRDYVVPLEQSQVLYDRLKSAGVYAELVIVQNAGHGFMPVSDNPISPNLGEISQRILRFLQEKLR